MSTFHELTCAPDECKIPHRRVLPRGGPFTYQDGLPQLDRPMWKHAEAPRDISAILKKYE